MLFREPPPFPRALTPFIKETGRGAKGARNLTRDEAREAMRIILSGEATPAQIGAFFQAERIKSESPEELAGFIEATRENCDKIAAGKNLRRIEIGIPYDGRLRAFHVLPFAAMLAARAGIQTFIHGEAGVGPKWGINAIEILHASGVEASGSIADADAKLNSGGVAWCGPAVFSPRLAGMRTIRNEVVLRGPLATVEKMLNLSGASALVAGNTHTPYGSLMAAAFGLLLESWGGAIGWVIQSTEGHIDIDPRRQTRARWTSGPGIDEERTFEANPSALADEGPPPDPPKIDPLKVDERRGWIEANVRWGMAALEGRTGAGRSSLVATTALLILASKMEADYAVALRRAAALLG